MDYDSNTSIGVNIADGGESGTMPVTGTITLNSTADNDAPSISGTATNPTATESGTGTNVVALIQAATGSATDVDATDFDGGTITVSLDTWRPGDLLTLAGTPTGVASISGGSGASLVINLNMSATPANLGAILEAIRFENTGDDPTVGGTDIDRAYSIVLNDGGNSPAPGQNSNTLMGTITLVGENEQPTATNTSQVIGYNEDDPTVAIADIVVTDTDVGEMITATLTLADTGAGSLSTSGTATYTPGTGVWTITDTVANVNIALANVAYIPAMHYNSNTSIGVNIADGGEDGTVAVTGTITLNGTADNDAPTISGTVTNPIATESGTGTNVVALIQAATGSAIDVDATDFDGGIITISLDTWQPGDVLTLAGTPTGVASINGGSSASLVINLNVSATPANLGAILEAIRFENTGDDPTVGGTDTDRVYSVVLNDGGNSPAPALNSNTLMGTITLVGESENAAPILISNGLTVFEGGVTILGPADLAATDADDNNANLVFSISGVTHGRFESADGGIITNFTQAQIIAGQVLFVHDGSEFAPSYSVTVSDGEDASGPSVALVSFIPVDDPLPFDPPDDPLPIDPPPDDPPPPEDDPPADPLPDGPTGGPTEVPIAEEILLEIPSLPDDEALLIDGTQDPGADNDFDGETTAPAQPVAVVAPVEGPQDTVQFTELTALLADSGQLDKLNELRDDVARDLLFQQGAVGSTFAVSTGLSIGYVAWLTRGGILLSSVLSSLPAWKLIDPLPVLARLGGDDDEDQDDDDSLESLVKESGENADNKGEKNPDSGAEAGVGTNPSDEP